MAEFRAPETTRNLPGGVLVNYCFQLNAEYDKRGFEQPFAGAVVHVGSPTFTEGDKGDLRFAGWQRSNLAPAQLWITVPPSLLARADEGIE